MRVLSEPEERPARHERQLENRRGAPDVPDFRTGVVPRSLSGGNRNRRAKPGNQTEKLSPQEQEALAFGLVNLKPPAISAEE